MSYLKKCSTSEYVLTLRVYVFSLVYVVTIKVYVSSLKVYVFSKVYVSSSKVHLFTLTVWHYDLSYLPRDSHQRSLSIFDDLTTNVSLVKTDMQPDTLFTFQKKNIRAKFVMLQGWTQMVVSLTL